jgi:hypothetical protein
MIFLLKAFHIHFFTVHVVVIPALVFEVIKLILEADKENSRLASSCRYGCKVVAISRSFKLPGVKHVGEPD